MKQIFLVLIVLSLSGCVGTATLVSCAANSKQYPENDIYNIHLSAKISTDGGVMTKTIPMQCIFKERSCGGGDWYFKWNAVIDKKLTFNLEEGKSLSVEIPSCTMALEYLGDNYPYGKSNLLFNNQALTISNEQLSQSAAKPLLGVQLLEFSVSEVVNE